MLNLKDFHQYFLQSVLSDSQSRGLLTAQSFFETVCQDLINDGELTNNYTQAEYFKRGMEVYGYDLDHERKILTLLTHQFYQDDTLQTLTRNEIDTKFKRLKVFFNKCLNGIYNQLEETSEAHSMSYTIYNLWHKQNDYRVRLMLLTDGKATRNLKNIPTESVKGTSFEFRVIDIEYLQTIYNSQNQVADFNLNVNLPCLSIKSLNAEYESYLTVVNGTFLVKIYEDVGQKLFEQNVRTFLQFRGGVNKGLKNTIEYKPEMFFAFNNGLTATASNVILNKEGNISKISNLQVVNGGQTTSAIYAAHKLWNLDVSSVNVQMKLSVVKNQNNQDDFVSKVAEYANTQNKINNSDFFSNSPFHKDMKDYSNRVFAPPKGGSQRRTHWFYERVRGEYLNSQAYLKKDPKNKFLLENPKDQVIDKTLLSKSENAWKQKPEIVSKGAQDSFKKFAEDISATIEKDSLAITESFFKDAIARIILFRTGERIITSSEWYDGGFRAQTVAYSIAYLSYIVENTGKQLNFNLIWEQQALPKSLYSLLEVITEKVYDKITQPPAGFANVTQWTKNAGCWESVKKLKIDSGKLDRSLLLDHEEQKYILKESKKLKKLDTSIKNQIFVHNTPAESWKKVLDFHKSSNSARGLNAMQTDLLEKMAFGKITLATDKQSNILAEIYQLAKSEGLDVI